MQPEQNRVLEFILAHRRILEVLLVAAIFATAGWMRLTDLDRFIASDELRWTCRSINFHAALAEGRFADTFQVGHPGVITMWLGTLGLPLGDAGPWRELAATTEGCTDLDALDDAGMEGMMQSVAPLLFKARRGIALGTTAMLLVLYLVLRAGVRLGAGPALGGLVLLAFDPFLLAHSRVLHVDAMSSLLGLVALAGLVAGGDRQHGWRPRWLALSGAFAGLAMLGKSSALLLGLFAAAWFTWQAWRGRDWRGPAKGLLVWGSAAAAAFVVAWPAMWVDPVGTVAGVLSKAQAEGAEPHASGNFFLGEVVEDPGPLFYPVAAAFRLTPGSLMALAVAVLLALFGARIYGVKGSPEPMPVPQPEAAAIRLVRTLLVWAVFFGAVMTLGPKKFDRYLLPALVAIDLAGGVAVVAVFQGGFRQSDLPKLRHGASIVAFSLFWSIGAIQMSEALDSLPYPLMYYNPLLGGPRAAREVLLVGWGEGYDLAAGYLNGLPGADQLVASARGVANFAPLFAGRTRSAAGFQPGRTDYVVLYQNEVQRRHDEELPAAYRDPPALDPVFVGRIGGIEMVWVYPNATLGPLEQALEASTRPGDVLVAGGETVLARHYQGPLTLLRYWGHWGEKEVEEDLVKDLPADWARIWVVRYPGSDPEATLNVLGRIAERGATRVLADGQVELTPFTRAAP